jgi:hypothetical protein
MIPINFRLSGGLNLTDPNHMLADNESPNLHNFIYRVNSDRPIVRPAIRVAVAAGEKFTTSIVKLHYYVKDASNQYLLCVSNDDLHYLDGSDEWQKIADLTAGSVPSMITFNGKLLVADGSGIYSWDGTTWATVTTSIKPSVLIEHDNRVVANDTQATGLDAVYLSAPEDETGWTATSVGGAVLVRAGYKDGMAVNGFASYNDNLIISKTSLTDEKRAIYRLQTYGNPYDSTTLAWKTNVLFNDTGADDIHQMLTADGSIYFNSQEGFRSIEDTDRYGDLMSQKIGSKIRPLFGGDTLKVISKLAYLPKMNAIFMFASTSNTFYAYFPWLGAFTTLGLADITFTDAVQAGDSIYLSGDNGYIYTFGDNYLYLDAPTPATTQNIAALAITKTVDFGVEGLLKKLECFIEPITIGTMTVSVKKNGGDWVEIGEYTLSSGSTATDFFTFLDDFGGLSTSLTTNPEQDLVATANEPSVYTNRARFRAPNMALRMAISGRCGLSGIDASVAVIGR